MANHPSALKRNRQNKKRCDRNKAYRTKIRTATKKVLAETEEKNKGNAEKELKIAVKAISKAASKGVLHKRTASRKISGLARKVHQISATV